MPASRTGPKGELGACRPFDLLLHSVQVNDSYMEYMVPLSNRLRRDVVRERVQSRSPQQHNILHSSAINDTPSTDREGTVGSHQAERHGTAPGPQMPSLSRLPHPALLRSKPRQVQGSAHPSQQLQPTSASVEWCCELRFLPTVASNKHPEAFQGLGFFSQKRT